MRDTDSPLPDETTSAPRPGRVSDLMLERYLLDELKPADKATLTQRLAADASLRERLESLRRENEEFAQGRDAEVFAHALRERARRERVHAGIRTERAQAAQDGSRLRSRFAGWKPDLRNFAGWKPALGGVLLVALVAVPAWHVLNGTSSLVAPGIQAEVPEGVRSPPAGNADGESAPPRETVTADARTFATDNANTRPDTPPASQTPPEGPREEPARARTEPPRAPATAERPSPNQHTSLARTDEEATRLKGLEPSLALFRRTTSGAEPLKPGTAVKPGDVLRIGYRAAGRSFGAIFSVDGHGNVTRHWPLTGDRAARLAAGETLLPGAFELDDAPSYERFYLLVSDRAFDLKLMLESLHASQSPAENDVELIRFDLLKENGI